MSNQTKLERLKADAEAELAAREANAAWDAARKAEAARDAAIAAQNKARKASQKAKAKK